MESNDLDTTTIVGYLDDKGIESLKKEHKVKNVHECITENEEGEKHATYFKKPTLEHIEALASYAKKGEEIKGLGILFNTCRIGGSADVIEDDEMRLAACGELAKLFKKREAIVKKR